MKPEDVGASFGFDLKNVSAAEFYFCLCVVGASLCVEAALESSMSRKETRFVRDVQLSFMFNRFISNKSNKRTIFIG